MEKHKSKALENECLCTKCVYRFQCFTQERIFSDPIYQGLFEALMAQGKSREEALDEVTREIKFRISLPPVSVPEPTITIPYPDNCPNTTPYPPITTPPWTIISYAHDDVSFDPVDGNNYQVSYTMHDGKEVSWNASRKDLFRELRVHRDGCGDFSDSVRN